MAGKDWRQSDAFFLASKILFFSCLFNVESFQIGIIQHDVLIEGTLMWC
jgi:hypothetical protein